MTARPIRKRSRRRALPTAILGAGRLARSLAPLLGVAGYPVVAVCAPRVGRARAVAGLAPGARATTSHAVALRDAELVLLAVPDRVISSLAGELSRLSAIPWTETVVLHHAGAFGIELLNPLAKRGAAVGVLHPMQCLRDAALAPRILPGSRARIEGDARARPAAERLAEALGMVPLCFAGRPTRRRRTAYHAAASMASNDLVALLSLALEQLVQSGLDPGDGLEALLALARGTLAHVERGGLEGALTGPVPRGDLETLQRHLDVLARVPAAQEIHRLASRRLARLARAHGEVEAAQRVERHLARRGK